MERVPPAEAAHLLADLQAELTDILERCVGELGMQLPLIITAVSPQGSVVVTRVNAGAEPDVLAEHYESGVFMTPINILVVSANSKAARVVIEGKDKVGRFH
jgi:hypothetical protein